MLWIYEPKPCVEMKFKILSGAEKLFPMTQLPYFPFPTYFNFDFNEKYKEKCSLIPNDNLVICHEKTDVTVNSPTFTMLGKQSIYTCTFCCNRNPYEKCKNQWYIM